jgi:general secretion pathway protein G
MKLKNQNLRRVLRRRGMTLIEIIVVVAIIGLLMAAVGVAVVPVLDQAKVDTAKSDIVTLQNALKTFYVKKGSYPDTGTGFKAVVDSQILEKLPTDPWGSEYVYLNEGGKPVVSSYGKDKQPGTEDDVSSKNLGDKK